jgi:hypothetical protein
MLVSELTQEQQWGLQFVVLQANQPIQAKNDALPPDQEPEQLWTDQSYLDFVIRSACDNYYQQLIEYKKNMTIQMFFSKTPEEQQQLVSLLGIPDVLSN